MVIRRLQQQEEARTQIKRERDQAEQWSRIVHQGQLQQPDHHSPRFSPPRRDWSKPLHLSKITFLSNPVPSHPQLPAVIGQNPAVSPAFPPAYKPQVHSEKERLAWKPKLMEVDVGLAAVDAAAPWADDDQALMDLLLSAGDASTPSSTGAGAGDAPPSPSSSVASSGGGRRKLTPAERRARHREVVRRSYHRNKQHMTGLRATVSALEARMAALQLQQAQQLQGRRVQQTQQLQGREQGQELEEEARGLREERAQLQETLRARAEFARQAQELVGSQSSDSDSDVDMGVTPPPSWMMHAMAGGCGKPGAVVASPLSTCTTEDSAEASSPGSARDRGDMDTSDEDLSPDTQADSKAFRSPKPTGLGSSYPPAPVAVDARREIGFKQLSFAQAKAIVKDTYRAYLGFSLSGRQLSTGARVLGWEDKRLVDGSTLNFALRKRFPDSNARALFTSTWDCLSDPGCAEAKFRGLLELRVLQRVNDDTIVAMRSMKSPDGSRWFRCVYLLFRVRTRNGFLLCIKSIDPPPVEGSSPSSEPKVTTNASDGRPVVWIDMSGWFLFDPLGFAEHSDPTQEFEECGAQVEYGGSWNYKDPQHIAQLAMDTLSVVLRWETTMVHPIFSLPPSTS